MHYAFLLVFLLSSLGRYTRLKLNCQRLPIEQQVSGDLFQLRERDIGILGRLGVVDQQNLYKALD